MCEYLTSGLDDARQSSGKAAAERDRSASRFDQLLGKKDKDAPGATKAVPRSLDDFMSNISSSSSSSSSKGTPKGGGAPDKKGQQLATLHAGALPNCLYPFTPKLKK